MASNVYVNGGLQLKTPTMGALASVPLLDFRQPTEVEKSTDETASIFKTFSSTRARTDKFTGTTQNLKTLLDAIPGPYFSRCVVGDGSNVGLALFGELLSQCDARASGSVHTRFRCKEGHIKLGTLQADNQQDASLTFEAVMTSSDGSDNLETAHNLSLPTMSAVQKYTLGKSRAGGVYLAGLTRFALEFQVEVMVRADEGSIEPSFAATITVTPKARLSFADFSKVGASIPKNGLLCSHANTLFQLIGLQHGAEHQDYGGNNHIAITMAGDLDFTDRGSASGSSEGSVELEIMGTKESTTAPLTINTATTYNSALS